MAHADAEAEPTAGDRIERQCPLRQLRRMLDLDRHHARPDLDPVDLVKGDGEDGQQIWVVGHLRHPDFAEALVLHLREVVHARINR